MVTVTHLLLVRQSGNGNTFVTGNKVVTVTHLLPVTKSGNGYTFVTGNKKW